MAQCPPKQDQRRTISLPFRKNRTEIGVCRNQHAIFCESSIENGIIIFMLQADFPDVNPVEESVNLMEAARSYQLNVSAIQTVKAMIQAAIQIAA